MPREKVLIELCCPFPYKAGGQFFATLAYPKRADGALRDRFLWALCRWQVVKRAVEETKFAFTPQPITPAIFLDDFALYWSALKKGLEKLQQRLIATHWILLPFLNELEGVEGEYPSVNELSKMAVESLGWRGKERSVPTFKAKVWRVTRPVAHATAAYLYCHKTCSRVTPVPFLQLCIQEPRLIAQIMEKSQEIGLMLPAIKQFTEKPFKEEELIEFSALIGDRTLHEFIDSDP